VLASCKHEWFFGAGPYGPSGPHQPGLITRLTYNVADDAMPALTPDGAAVWYSFVPTERRDRDSCLGLLPVAGGSRIATRCWPVPDADSTDTMEWPAPAADGRLALVHTSSRRFAQVPDAAELLLAPPGVTAPQRLLTLPFRGRGDRGFDRAAFIHWPDANTLLFVGQLWAFFRPPLGGTPHTLISGVSLERLTLGDSLPVKLMDGASALDLVPGSGVLHFTLNGDSRVLAMDLATGDTTTVWDFGTAGIARDPRVRGGHLLAVVGGAVSAGYDSVQGIVIQTDAGGYLRLVDLAGGTDVPVGDTAVRYRHPVLSADGRRAIVEVVGPAGNDLWEIALP
jgi:hypothetical protein